jgi:hypothetical protein
MGINKFHKTIITYNLLVAKEINQRSIPWPYDAFFFFGLAFRFGPSQKIG